MDKALQAAYCSRRFVLPETETANSHFRLHDR